MATFVSNFKELRVILRPSWVKREGLNQSLIQGLYAQFHDGKFVTDNQEIIDGLRKHNRYGVQFLEQTSTSATPAKVVPAAKEAPPVVKPKTAKKPKVKPAPDADVH